VKVKDLCIMENRESKYLAFEDSFKSSGLSQKAYSKQKGITSMVSYYLGKARELRKTKDATVPSVRGFQKLELLERQDQASLRIELPTGIIVMLTL